MIRLCGKLSQRLINIVAVGLPRSWVDHSVESRATSKRPTRGRHDADLGLPVASVGPACLLLGLVGEVDVRNKVEVWSCSDPPVMKSYEDTCRANFSANNLANGVSISGIDEIRGKSSHVAKQ